MSRCEEIRELLSAKLDNELSAEESRVLAEHLSACASCRRELERLDRVWKGLSALGDIQAPVGLEDRIFRHALRERARVSRRRHLRWAIPLGVAAAVLIALFLAHFAAKPQQTLDPTTVQIVTNIEVLQNLDILENLEMLEKMGPAFQALPALDAVTDEAMEGEL
jgi:anti-sigma factor RsiW